MVSVCVEKSADWKKVQNNPESKQNGQNTVKVTDSYFIGSFATVP